MIFECNGTHNDHHEPITYSSTDCPICGLQLGLKSVENAARKAQQRLDDVRQDLRRLEIQVELYTREQKFLVDQLNDFHKVLPSSSSAFD